MRKKNLRVTLDLGPDSQRRLVRLQEALEGETKVGVLKKALQWLEFVVDVDEKGGQVILEDENGTQKPLLVLGVSKTRAAAAR